MDSQQVKDCAMDKVNDSLIDRLRTDAEWFAVPSSHYYHNELWETRDLLREAANALVAQNKPCTDAKEQGHGCYRAVKAENELAEQKEQFRVLEDEMLVMMDERNAAVARSTLACALRALLLKCPDCGGTGEVGTGIIQIGQPAQMPCFVCSGERQILLRECGK